jgi:uncharacterized protein
MSFDDNFDEEKSERTKKDRGIDFLEAREIWDDPLCVDGAPGNVISGENRWLIVGKAKGKLWTACYTIRSSKIRIISVRPARQEEREIYEG